MSELDNLEMNQSQQRPTFLTVLCILTFIGSGWGIISNLITLSASGMTEELVELNEAQMEEAMEEIGDQPGSGFLESIMQGTSGVMENMTEMAIIGIIASILCLAGAIMMWKLQKKGFYIYTVGEIGAPIAMAMLVGGAFGGMMLFGLFIPIIMVILYALNLKHMS